MGSAVLTHTATNAVLQWLLRSRNPVAAQNPRNGRYDLPYGTPYRATMAVIVLISAFFLGFSCYALKDDPKGLLLAGGIFGLMFAGSAFAFHDAFFVRIGFSSEGLVRESRFGSPRRISWSAVTKMDYSMSCHWFVFRAAVSSPIRVSIYRSGLATLAECAGRGLAGGPADGSSWLIREKGGISG